MCAFFAGSSIEPVSNLMQTGRWIIPAFFAVMAAFGLLIRNSYSGKRSIQLFDFYIIFWISLAFLSASYSIDSDLTIYRSITLLIMYLAIFRVIWAITDLAGEERIISIIVFSAIIIYLLGFASLVVIPGHAFMQGRYNGILENPNAVGGLTAIVFPLLFGRLILYRKRLYYAMVGLALVSLLLCGQRSGIGVTVATTFYVIWRSRAKGRLYVGFFVILIVSLVLYKMGTQSISETIVRPETLETGAGRDIIWKLMQGYIEKRPYLGHGFGTEDLLHGIYGVLPKAYGFRGEYASNAYIGLTAQLGYFGSILFFVPLIILFLKNFFSRYGSDLTTVTLNAVLLAGLMLCLTESWIYSMGNILALPFWTSVMLLIRRSYIRRLDIPVRDVYDKTRNANY
jgi:exopolysaccharide production protein ExoQ